MTRLPYQNLVTRSKPITQALGQVNHRAGFKNTGYTNIS
jgi:hypothetical protein